MEKAESWDNFLKHTHECTDTEYNTSSVTKYCYSSYNVVRKMYL